MPRPHIKLITKTVDGQTMVSLVAYNELLGDWEALNRDVTELRKNSGALLDSEVAELTRVRQENLEMKARLDELALFIREHYQWEISTGAHKGCVDAVDVALLYMGRERARTKRKGEPWWVRFLKVRI